MCSSTTTGTRRNAAGVRRLEGRPPVMIVLPTLLVLVLLILLMLYNLAGTIHKRAGTEKQFLGRIA